MELSYDFKKTIYTENELLEEFSMSRSYLYQIVKDWIKQGGDPGDMGKLTRMAQSNRWDPRLFLTWVHNHKLYKTKKYHNEEVELKKVNSFFVANTNNQQRKEAV